MANRTRGRAVLFWLSEEEYVQIKDKMSHIGMENMSAFIRKMLLDGYVVNLDIPELREMISLLRRSSNNLNQIAKRVNTTGRLYAADMDEMLKRQEQLWEAANTIITRLAAIK